MTVKLWTKLYVDWFPSKFVFTALALFYLQRCQIIPPIQNIKVINSKYPITQPSHFTNALWDPKLLMCVLGHSVSVCFLFFVFLFQLVFHVINLVFQFIFLVLFLFFSQSISLYLCFYPLCCTCTLFCNV